MLRREMCCLRRPGLHSGGAHGGELGRPRHRFVQCLLQRRAWKASTSLCSVPLTAEKGTIVVDNSSAFQMVGGIPLVIPEVNTEAMKGIKVGMGKGALIFNLNCSTIICLMAVTRLHHHAKAKYLFPEESRVKELINLLKEKKIRMSAHFYMDPEVQGVLTASQKHWPHIYISDSLIMADAAVKMAKAGCQFITVLGVDFMFENVCAILDQAGFGELREVGVYRMSDETFGCSLADAASAPAYLNYLEAASLSPPSLHVVYINKSGSFLPPC